MRIIKKIVVHHSAGGKYETISAVNLLHKKKNWGTIARPAFVRKSELGWHIQYHYYIDRQGVVTQTRNDSEIGWHSGNSKMNKESIGICLSGNFNLEMPNEAQEKSLAELLYKITQDYKLLPEDIIPHKGVIKTECYGQKLNMTWAQDILIKHEVFFYAV